MTDQQPGTAIATREERVVSFIPFGAKEEIKLSAAMVSEFIAIPTRSGKLPEWRDCVRFVMLCKAQLLNPFAGDAYMIGFDTDGVAKFNLITSHQAFTKRAEASPEYDGSESGVCVLDKEEKFIERQGDLLFHGERLIGGWARVHFKTRKIPMFKRLQFSTFDTGMSRWKKDPAGMIVKCAEADALRSSFPTLLGGLYLEAELEPSKEIVVGEPAATAAPQTVSFAKRTKSTAAKDASATDVPTAAEQQGLSKAWNEATESEVVQACNSHPTVLNPTNKSPSMELVVKAGRKVMLDVLDKLHILKAERKPEAEKPKGETLPKPANSNEETLRTLHADATPDDRMSVKSQTGAEDASIEALLALPEEDQALAVSLFTKAAEQRGKSKK